MAVAAVVGCMRLIVIVLEYIAKTHTHISFRGGFRNMYYVRRI